MKIPFTLKQHTPLIHFQHEQAGATLRATEVKPKLDRFLIQQKGGNIPTDWKVGGDKAQFEALNYKLRFTGDEKSRIRINLSPNQSQGKWEAKFPAFFANMGKEFREELKDFSMYDQVHGQVICLNPDLKDHIAKHLADFFARHNFGTRQSKGFGSFTLAKPEGMATASHGDYYFDVRINDNPNELGRQKTLLETIDLFYRSLRSGLNLYGRDGQTLYFKSMLFLYALNKKGQQWDKKSIKEHFRFFDRYVITQKEAHDPESDSPLGAATLAEKPLLRDIFGLSTEQSWHSYRKTLKKEGVEPGARNDPKYARFKSPILFKPVKRGDHFRVYFGVAPDIKTAFRTGDAAIAAEAGFLNQAFHISFQEENQPGLTLRTPASFDFDDFFRFAFSVDIAFDHVDEAWHSSWEFRKLRNIYEQLHKQV